MLEAQARFGVLGSIDVQVADRVVTIATPQLRVVLGVLLVNANRVVPNDRLVDLLWGAEATDSSATALHKLFYRLRAALPPEARPAIETTTPGYMVRVEADEYDAALFESLATAGQRALADQDPASALASLDRALGLWRGDAFAELADQEFAKAEASRLEDLRLGALEDRAEAKLCLGRHQEVTGELEALAAAHPYRERLWAQLMLALYRSRRQADALRAYQQLRRRLGEELGIEPSVAIRELEGAILRQDPQVEWHGASELDEPRTASPDDGTRPAIPVVAAPRARRRGRRTVTWAAGVVAVLVPSYFAASYLAGGSEDNAAVGARSGPFTVRYEATFVETLITTEHGSNFMGNVTGGVVGKGTYSGISDTRSSPPLCGDGSVPTQTSVVSKAGNGDVLRETHDGGLCQSSPTSLEFTGTYTIQGGTGCFADARGHGKTSAHILLPRSSTDVGSAISTTDGSITLQRLPNCPTSY